MTGLVRILLYFGVFLESQYPVITNGYTIASCVRHVWESWHVHPLNRIFKRENRLYVLYYHVSFGLSVPTDYKRLANFTVLVGEMSDWPLNHHCYSQLSPVPMGATVEYPCEKLRLGHLVSINKTASAAEDVSFRMLMLHEVQVYGYTSGMLRTIDKNV